MTEQLPENISALYPDTSVGDTAHQHHHDVIHQRVNNLPDLTSLTAHDADTTAVHGIADTTTLVLKSSLPLNVKDYGAVGDGVTNDTAAIVAAVAAARSGGDRGLYFPLGAYACNNITIGSNLTITSAGAAYLLKNANGPVLILNGSNIDVKIKILGQGATYTGVGVEIQSANDYRWRGYIGDTESYCIDHTVNDAALRGGIAGPVFLQTRGAILASVRYPPNEVNGDRTMHAVITGGGPLADFAGCANLVATACNASNIVFGALSKKVLIIGCRIASAGATTTIHGTSHLLTGTSFAGSILLDTDTDECVFAGSDAINGVIDNGSNNTVQQSLGFNGITPYTIHPGNLGGLSALNANQAVYMRITNGKGSISKIGFHVGASSGNVSVAVYKNTGKMNNAVPGTRRATSGSVPCPAIGYAEVTIGTISVSTDDWFSLVADNVVATFYRVSTTGFTSTIGKGLSAHQNSAFPQPNPAVPSTSALFSLILIGTI